MNKMYVCPRCGEMVNELHCLDEHSDGNGLNVCAICVDEETE